MCYTLQITSIFVLQPSYLTTILKFRIKACYKNELRNMPEKIAALPKGCHTMCLKADLCMYSFHLQNKAGQAAARNAREV